MDSKWVWYQWIKHRVIEIDYLFLVGQPRNQQGLCSARICKNILQRDTKSNSILARVLYFVMLSSNTKLLCENLALHALHLHILMTDPRRPGLCILSNYYPLSCLCPLQCPIFIGSYSLGKLFLWWLVKIKLREIPNQYLGVFTSLQCGIGDTPKSQPV